MSGTASGTIQILFDDVGVITASSGQDWTLSTGVILESGTFPVTMQHMVQERSSGGSMLAATNIEIEPTSSHKRFVTSRTLTDGSTAFVSAGVRFPAASGAVDCTFVILAPQLEQKAYPTSPILPPKGDPGAATRAADEIHVDGESWINADGGTLYVEATLNSQHTDFDRSVAYISDNSYNNRLFLGITTDGKWRGGGYTSSGNTNTEITVTPALAAGVSGRAAVTALSNDGGAMSAQNGTQSTDATLGNYSGSLNRLDIGSDHSAANPINAYIKQIRYFPATKNAAQLETLVGNS
jgi:hypothetical protein